MDLIESLKKMVHGINPVTGKNLPATSITHKIETARVLLALIDELDTTKHIDKPTQMKASKPRVDEEEKMQKNIAEGKPKRSHLYWSDEEQKEACAMFKDGASIEAIAAKMMRGARAIAIKLEKAGLISEDQLALYSAKKELV